MNDMRKRVKRSPVWILLVMLFCLRNEAGASSWKEFPVSGSPHLASGLSEAEGIAGKPVGFRLRSSQETGIQFVNVLTDSKIMVNLNLMNGSGVALGDFNSDGLCDVYLPNLNGSNALYMNLGGWRFRDVTRESGLEMEGMDSTGATFVDTDGDGDLDLLVTTMGNPNMHYQNNGNGTFSVRRDYPGSANKQGSTSMALADVDGDGDLDLYVTNFGVQSLVRSGGIINITYRNGVPVVRGRNADRIRIIDGVMYELGEEDYFYLNDGNGGFVMPSGSQNHFRDTEGQPLKRHPMDQGLCVSFRDLNEDRHPDIYICNDAFTPDRFYINDGKGNFSELASHLFRKTPFFSMGADFADIDRDGDTDFFVVDMLSRRHLERMTQRSSMPRRPAGIGSGYARDQVRRNNLYLNRGDGSFAEIANFAQVAASGWSWSTIFMDVDMDGWEDILITNSIQYDVDDRDTMEEINQRNLTSLADQRRAVLTYPILDTPNYAFRNLRNLQFEETGESWGFSSSAISNGMASADMDNDGDLDVLVNTLNSQLLVYENISQSPRILVRLRGEKPNTFGVGAKITLKGGPVMQSQEMMAGGRYMSGDAYERVFAALDGVNHTVEVEWRNGSKSILDGLRAGNAYIISESSAVHPESASSQGSKERVIPQFEDASAFLAHQHVELDFDDFSRQPLLPRKMSRLGPGVAIADFDGDRLDDIAIGAGRSGQISILHNAVQSSGKLEFHEKKVGPFLADDAMGLVGIRFHQSQPRATFISGMTNYEGIHLSGNMDESLSIRADASSLNFAAPSGSLVAADIDGDEDIDIVVGGTVIPGRYPHCTSTRIFLNHNNNLQLATEIKSVGSVRGLALADLDLDGHCEIIIAQEWGSIEVYAREDQAYTNVTKKWGLGEESGLWQSVLAVDINQDGKTDLVAGNWGVNDYYLSEGYKKIFLHYPESFLSSGLPIIESYQSSPDGKILPYRDRSSIARVFPEILQSVPSHRQFAQMSLAEIFPDTWSGFQTRAVSELRSSIFLNMGDHFMKMLLPDVAQFTPVFGLVSADWNMDGFTDLFLAQNFFPQSEDAPKLDAGRGLLLHGDGAGNFTEIPADHSGIKIYGEQRGAAAGDFNNDGKPDLVVTQNADATKLYINQSSQSGKKIYLSGPPANPDGLGASVVVKRMNGFNEVISIVAGGGYYSQSSIHPIISQTDKIISFEVHWPGGRTTQHAYNDEAGSQDIHLYLH